MNIFKLFGSVFVDTEKANDSLAKTDKKAEKTGGSFLNLLKTTGKVGLGIGAAFGTMAGVVAAGLIKIANDTREYRNEMGKLETAFTTQNHSAETAKRTYQELQGILGDTGQSVEAANHLAELADNQEQLSTWTNICTGVYAKFGASLPIESLTEASNETAKTGTLTGSLADALNWAGVNEESFQAKLDKCNNERERSALITETLNGLYSESAKKYKETNKEIIDANMAQEKLNSSLATLGSAIEPIITMFMVLLADLINGLTPVVEMIANTLMPAIMSFLNVAMPILFDVLQKVIDVGINVVSNISSFVETIISKFTQGGISFESIMSGISNFFQNTFNVIKDIWFNIGKPIFDFFAGAIGLVFEYVQSRMPQIQAFISAAFNDIKIIWENNLKPCFQAIANFIQNILAPAFKFVFQNQIVPLIDSTFKMIKDLWNNSLKPIFTGIIDFITGIFTLNFKKAFQGIISAVSGIFGGIVSIVKQPLNTVIGIINKFIGGLNKLKIPDWVPGLGGSGINIPKIPLLAKGGRVYEGGQAIVGEAGAELIDLPAGAKVSPLTNSSGSLIDSEEIIKVLHLILEELKYLNRTLYDKIIDALINGVRIDWSDRELARLVRKYV